jgi:hypothetical protein
MIVVYDSCYRWPKGSLCVSGANEFRKRLAEVHTAGLFLYGGSAREYFKDDPLVPIEEWEIPASSDLATHR